MGCHCVHGPCLEPPPLPESLERKAPWDRHTRQGQELAAVASLGAGSFLYSETTGFRLAGPGHPGVPLLLARESNLPGVFFQVS